MTPATSPLKFHLQQLAKIFAGAGKMKADEVLELDAQSARTILQTLRILTQQAGHLELELSILRDSEAGKLLARTAEQLATGELTGLLDKAESNIIRPNFGGKNNDGQA
ncbi:hypothetical protein [Agrobacterium pusense]|uniref:hypothetical protein n=1 Tax=Agrobacterium pusense TaxID=648995 RepID=UPI000ECB4B3D|nr:hypothetical protein [Agrobacterium sp.]